MQVIVWIVIILVAILLIWLLRKWIKRLIFIIILLALAFFIYGIFNPSGASRLWYNVRTFPQRVSSWISDKAFIDYDSYRLDISSVWAIWEDDDNNNAGVDSVRKVTQSDKNVNNDEVLSDKWDEKDLKDKTVQSFAGITPTILELDWLKNSNLDKNEVVTWYSKMDVLWIIGKYIENNLDDDTDILVTIEYENDYNNPNKIVLQTQGKNWWKFHFVSIPRLSVKKVLNWLRNSKIETVKVVTWETEKLQEDTEESQEKSTSLEKRDVNKFTSNNTTYNNTTYNGLTQNEIREAEEMFSILF